MIGLVVLTTLIVLFEIWWLSAYLVAYRHLHQRLLLFPVVQGAAMAAVFAIFTALLVEAGGATGPVNTTLLMLAIALLLVGLGVNYAWRARGGTRLLAQHYPRGLFDVLAFRRPAVDLKRRVRSK